MRLIVFVIVLLAHLCKIQTQIQFYLFDLNLFVFVIFFFTFFQRLCELPNVIATPQQRLPRALKTMRARHTAMPKINVIATLIWRRAIVTRWARACRLNRIANFNALVCAMRAASCFCADRPPPRRPLRRPRRCRCRRRRSW